MIKQPIKIDCAALMLLVVCAFVMLPFLGLAEFNTKGEPREAVVAYSILESGDWILPTNNGGEMPYKPPFFHWCIAALSLLNGGHVDEYMSRLPSALALIAMTVWTFVFFARRRDMSSGIVAALVAFTTFELHRAGANCRVDMMLTALTVGALFSLFRWYERGMNRIPVAAILLMSCATLTKGPVGMLIPCLVMGVFLLLRGVGFFKALLLLAVWGISSLVLPMAWYLAAYNQGGQEFLDLVLEENFGRMTSTMSYDSCVNPWPYNVLMLITGFLPWTLVLIMSLFVLPYGRCRGGCVVGAWHRFRAWLAGRSPVDLFAAVAAVVIFVFYCIPQSKRSVYLMPLYPFAAYFIARYLVWLAKHKMVVLKVFGDIMAISALALFVCFLFVKTGLVPESVFGSGRHAETNIRMLNAIAGLSGFYSWLWIVFSPLAAVAWWSLVRRRACGVVVPVAVSMIVMAIYVSLSGAFQPAVLNVKSVKDIAEEIDRVAPASEGALYEFIERCEFADGDPIHYFEIDFYLGDRISSFYKQRPSSGFLLVGDEDADKFFPQFVADGYVFEQRYTTPRPLLGQKTRLYRFVRHD